MPRSRSRTGLNPALRRLLAPLLALALPLLLIGCPPAEQVSTGGGPSGDPANGGLKRIVILTNGDDPCWDACQAGAEDAEETLLLDSKGYRLSFERASFTPESQVDLLRQYQTAGDVAGLGICVVDAESSAIARELKTLQEQGTQVITIDNDLNVEKYRDHRTVYLGTDNFQGGVELGRAAAALRPDGGRYVAFVGIESATNSQQRTDGFAEGAGEKFTEIERQSDGGKEDVARDMVRSSLENHDQVDALVGIYAYNAPAAVQIAEQMGRLDDLIVCSFDAAEKSIAAMADGKVDVMVVQNPFAMGSEGVQTLLAMCEGDDETLAELFPKLNGGDQESESEGGEEEPSDDADIRSTGLKVVVPEGSPLTADLFEDDTEFMTLPEFQAWLKKYGLRSS